MPPKLLTEELISNQLKQLKGWSRTGKEIRKVAECSDFVHAMALVNSTAMLAEKLDHHPDIDIRWNKVTFVLSTHSAGGLTDLDFKLAQAIDEL